MAMSFDPVPAYNEIVKLNCRRICGNDRVFVAGLINGLEELKLKFILRARVARRNLVVHSCTRDIYNYIVI